MSIICNCIAKENIRECRSECRGGFRIHVGGAGARVTWAATEHRTCVRFDTPEERFLRTDIFPTGDFGGTPPDRSQGGERFLRTPSAAIGFPTHFAFPTSGLARLYKRCCIFTVALSFPCRFSHLEGTSLVCGKAGRSFLRAGKSPRCHFKGTFQDPGDI